MLAIKVWCVAGFSNIQNFEYLKGLIFKYVCGIPCCCKFELSTLWCKAFFAAEGNTPGKCLLSSGCISRITEIINKQHIPYKIRSFRLYVLYY